MFLEISQNSQENTCGIASFWVKLQVEATASDLSGVFSPGIAPHGGKELENMNFAKMKEYSVKKT